MGMAYVTKNVDYIAKGGVVFRCRFAQLQMKWIAIGLVSHNIEASLLE